MNLKKYNYLKKLSNEIFKWIKLLNSEKLHSARLKFRKWNLVKLKF